MKKLMFILMLIPILSIGGTVTCDGVKYKNVTVLEAGPGKVSFRDNATGKHFVFINTQCKIELDKDQK